MALATIGNLIVDEAYTWLNTPYVWGSREKGIGADCLNVFAACTMEKGLARHVPYKIPGIETLEHLENNKFDVLVSTVDMFFDLYLLPDYKKWTPMAPMREDLRPGDLVLSKSNKALKYSDHAIIIVNSSKTRPMGLHFLKRKEGEIKMTKTFLSAAWEITAQFRVIKNHE